jgi:hypothetical protein
MRHVSPGSKQSISAADWNRLADLANRSPDTRGGGPLVRDWAFPYVHVENTAGDQERGAVLAIQEPRFDFADASDDIGLPLFLGVTPTVPTYLGRFAVLLEPVKAGKIARAILHGMVKARVEITNERHRYADIVDGDSSKLVSRPIGGAQIIAAKSGTGLKWAWVNLGIPFSRVLQGQLLAALPAGDVGPVTILDGHGGTYEGECECRLLVEGQQLPDEAGVELIAQPDKDELLVIASGACPEDIPEEEPPPE